MSAYMRMLVIFTSDSSTCLHPLANDGDWAAEKPKIAHASTMETERMETPLLIAACCRK